MLKGKYRKLAEQKLAASARHLLDIARSMPDAVWKDCSWTTGDGKRHHSRVAWQEVFLARGLKEPDGQLEKVWLVVDWPTGAPEPYHCYLAHFHRQPSKARCLKLSRSRWHVEQYFQRSKDDLGLDHFEGRSWRGFHHHLVLSALAYLFILTIYLEAKKTSGLTLEKILESIRPWLLRSTGHKESPHPCLRVTGVKHQQDSSKSQFAAQWLAPGAPGTPLLRAFWEIPLEPHLKLYP